MADIGLLRVEGTGLEPAVDMRHNLVVADIPPLVVLDKMQTF